MEGSVGELVYYRMRAANALAGFDSSKHSGVISLTEEQLAHARIFVQAVQAYLATIEDGNV